MQSLKLDAISSKTDKLVGILNGDALLEGSFFEIADLIDGIISHVPFEDYNSAILLVESLSNQLLELEDSNSLDGEKEIGYPHLTIVYINLSLSIYLEMIGLYAKSYNVLSKAKDPWANPFDFATQIGEVTLSRTIEIDLLLINIANVFPQQVRAFFLKRAYTDFKLSTVLGNVNNEATLAFDQYKQFTSKFSLTLLDIKFYTNYLELYSTSSVAHSHRIDEIIEILKNWYTAEKNYNNRFLIASTLAKTLKEKTWIEAALREKETYYWEEYFNMLILNECFEEQFDEQVIVNILYEFLNLTIENYGNRMLFDLYKQKNSILYTTVLYECIKRQNYRFAMYISYNWNAFKPDNTTFQQIEDANICLLLPNLSGIEGVIFIIKYSDIYKIIPLYSNTTIEEIFELKNIIEESWQILTGQEIEYDLSSISSQRRQVEASVEYVKKISDFIQIDSLVSHFKNIPSEISFEYIESTWLNIPIISILSSHLDNNFYITSGFNTKKPASTIRKAMVWFNDDRMTYAQFELEAIEFLLKEKNIQLDVYKDDQLTKELFLEQYQNTTYDLVWIVTHGQFDFNNPPNSRIYISPSETITTWELQNISLLNESKRQLILNACYSGCSDVRHNSMGFIGIAPSLTSRFQDVVGHLWFVHDLASATLGIFTLDYLLQDFDLADSVKLASRNMLSDNQVIADKIKTINSEFEIIDRISSTNIELKQPFYSMSLVVYN